MSYILSTTSDYHIHDLNSLGWELTVCNALHSPSSPARLALKTNQSFGYLLYEYLKEILPLHSVRRVLEIGGGTGNLMHDFLLLNNELRPTMIDISPYLLKRQKEQLSSFDVDFMELDILDADLALLSGFDLVIMNENLGDLPTLIAHPSAGSHNSDAAKYLERVQYFAEKYILSVTANENINIGAMEVLEKLCLSSIKFMYLSEHSCEAAVPENLKNLVDIAPTGNPEKIALRGHCEYTIKFSHLQKIAQMFNYRTIRGPFADFLKLNFNDKVRTALKLTAPHSDEQEILRQFVYDLFKYEYLVLIKGG